MDHVMKNRYSDWRNPPSILRMALVAAVYGVLGLLGGLYADLFLGGAFDPTAAAFVGALLGVPFGAWFERDPPLANSDGGDMRDSPDQDVRRRLDE
jgi:hypothetical protein